MSFTWLALTSFMLVFIAGLSVVVIAGNWQGVPIRIRLNRWLDPAAYVVIGPHDTYLAAKAKIYATLGEMVRGAGLRLLNEISRELVVDDPALSLLRAQTQAGQLATIAQVLNPPEFLFLCLSAVDHTLAQIVADAPAPL